MSLNKPIILSNQKTTFNNVLESSLNAIQPKLQIAENDDDGSHSSKKRTENDDGSHPPKKRILRWSYFPKYSYVSLVSYRKITSKYHQGFQIIVSTSEDVWYYLPKAQWSSAESFKFPCYVFAKEKTIHLKEFTRWNILWFPSQFDLLLSIYEQFTSDLENFIKEKIKASCRDCVNSSSSKILNDTLVCGSCEIDREFFTVEKEEFKNFTLSDQRFKLLDSSSLYTTFLNLKKFEKI